MAEVGSKWRKRRWGCVAGVVNVVNFIVDVTVMLYRYYFDTLCVDYSHEAYFYLFFYIPSSFVKRHCIDQLQSTIVILVFFSFDFVCECS